MTTTELLRCRHVLRPWEPDYDEQVECGHEAAWQTSNGEPRCEMHADGFCRRLGPVRGDED